MFTIKLVFPYSVSSSSSRIKKIPASLHARNLLFITPELDLRHKTEFFKVLSARKTSKFSCPFLISLSAFSWNWIRIFHFKWFWNAPDVQTHAYNFWKDFWFLLVSHTVCHSHICWEHILAFTGDICARITSHFSSLSARSALSDSSSSQIYSQKFLSAAFDVKGM